MVSNKAWNILITISCFWSYVDIILTLAFMTFWRRKKDNNLATLALNITDLFDQIVLSLYKWCRKNHKFMLYYYWKSFHIKIIYSMIEKFSFCFHQTCFDLARFFDLIVSKAIPVNQVTKSLTDFDWILCSNWSIPCWPSYQLD